EQVARTPDYIAVFGLSVETLRATSLQQIQQITYRQLNEQANHLAQHLQEKGVANDVIVGVMVPRSLELMIALMGVLKAGGAYLPIDPEFPQERVDYMLKDSNAKILINKSEARISKFETNPNDQNVNVQNKNEKCHEAFVLNFENLNLNSIKGCPRRGLSDFGFRISNLNPSNLAYVIYTSGSTGKPKGVMVGHRGVINFINGVGEIIDFSVSKTIAALTTVSFDIFVLETFLPLCRGMRVVMVDEKQQKDMAALNRLLVRNRVTMLQATPSMVRLMMHHGVCNTALAGLKEIMVGGEPLPEVLLKDLQQVSGLRIYNMYGPTETTVWSTVRELTQDLEVTVGRPIANTYIYSHSSMVNFKQIIIL
ncbi:MAG: AMP-binding protein, partial [Acidobacteria bacterium]|nr:AMP-binding protein [Acidobacteriota bacterium]